MRRVVFVTVPPVQLLDLTGPFEVFARSGMYEVKIVSSEPTPRVRSSAGLTVVGASHYRQLRGVVDTLIVPGGTGAEMFHGDAAFLAWLRRVSARARRVASVCTGAFVLAAAGLLDGRRATTHWDWCNRLSTLFPRVSVDVAPIFVKDAEIYTSAGVTAGIDLALEFVREDHGSRAAQLIARDLVMYMRREGAESQFSAFLPEPTRHRGALDTVLRWIPEHLADDLSADALATRCNSSPRQFARTFVASTGMTPGKFVERMRVMGARAALDEGVVSLKEVAARSGFSSVDTMRRAFLRVLELPPSEYRAQTSVSVSAPALR